MTFDDIQDVEDWLAPLDYLAFWAAMEPYGLRLQGRDHCDGLITSGKVEAGLILDVLKSMAVSEIASRFDLEDRIYEPLAAQGLRHIH